MTAICGAIIVSATITLAIHASPAQPAAAPFAPETPAWPENPPETWPIYHPAHPGPDRAIPADPNCAIYYKGRYHALMTWARWDCFAPESLLTPDGRRVRWAWCTPWINGMQKVGRPEDLHVRLFRKGGDVSVKRVSSWMMKSIHTPRE